MVEPPLQLIPKELSEILMWTERERAGHGAYVVVLEEVVRDPDIVWVGVVVAANGVSMATKKLWDGFGVRALG